MKYAAPIFLSLVFSAGIVTAQETAEQFAAWLPEMASNDLAKREAAQQGWQKICMRAGAPGRETLLAEVNKLMVEALEKGQPTETTCWLLQQLQWTGDATVVPVLVKLLDSAEDRVRDRAARALGANPSPQAAEGLLAAARKSDALRAKTIADALSARKTDLKVSVENLKPLSLPYEDEATFDAWMQTFDTLSPVDQARTLAAIKVRKAAKYHAHVVRSVESNDAFVKRNAILALEKIAVIDDLPLLLDLSAGDDRKLIEGILAVIAVDGFDEALLRAFEKEKDAGRAGLIASALSRRSVAGAASKIIARAKQADCPNRLELLTAAERLSGKGQIGDFVGAALLIPVGRERDDAEKIVARLAKGDATPVVAQLTDANAAEMLPMIGRIGGKTAWDSVTRYRQGPMENAAIRALCNWPSAVVADDLLQIAENAASSDANKIAALRAFVRVISLPDNEIGIKITPAVKMEKLKKGFEIARRADEKRLIIERAGAIRDVESARFIIGFFDDAAFQETAFRSFLNLAHHDYLRRPNKELFKPALERVIAETKTQELRDRAKLYLSGL